MENKFSNNNEGFSESAVIKVLGIGGAGCNAVNRMIEEGVQGVEFWVVNTDSQVLANSKTANRIILGKDTTRGLGAGADPNKGRDAAVESEEEIKQVLRGTDLLFIAAGMGGGTGTGAAPVVGKIARDLGILTIGIVTKPFQFEGKTRNVNGDEGLHELKAVVDSLIVVSNDKLLDYIGNVPMHEAFHEADKILRQGVQTITDLIAVPAQINLDFADVRTIIQDKGYALIGIGMANGENKSQEAAYKAVSSPLLEASIAGAKHAIINVTGGTAITLKDAQEAVGCIRELAGGEIDIIFGVAINDNLDDDMIVTVIATGYDDNSIEQANMQNQYQKQFMLKRSNQPETVKQPSSSHNSHDLRPHRSGLPVSPTYGNETNRYQTLRRKQNLHEEEEMNTQSFSFQQTPAPASVETELDEIPSFLKQTR